MAKKKYPSELNTRQIRVNVGDWQLLMMMSRKLGITVAKALHLAITQQANQEQIVTPRTQIPMPLTTAFPVRPRIQRPMSVTTAYQSIPKTAIATNGDKGVAFRIKPKGVRDG